MTSKSLFTNLLKENMKRRIWMLVLSCLAFFFALPVTLSVMIQNAKSSIYQDYSSTISDIINTLGSQSLFLVGITIVGSVLCGISGFSYLHSKKKVDFYHSLPLKRELLFAVSYLNGLLLYVVPYIIGLAASFLIIKANGYLTKEVAIAGLIGLGVHTLFYTILYTFSIIAVCLTGNILISLFACGTLFLYGPAIYLLCSGMFENFFSYYSAAGHPEELLFFLSPVTFYCKVVSSRRYGSPYIDFSAGALCISLLLLILTIAIAIFLYKKRSSEAAGKAIAFRFIEAPVKFLIVIPVSLAAGLFGQNIVTNGGFTWYVFGSLCGFLLSYGIMEVIYHFDIRKAFAHKIHLIACAGITFMIILLFQTDAFHYDSYLPDQKDIKSMSVHFGSIDQYVDCYEISENEFNYISAEEYALDHMELTDFSAAYEIIEDYLASNDNKLLSENEATDNIGDWHTFFSVKYTLKSGKDVYRYYFINGSEYENLIGEVYNAASYKEGAFPVYQMKTDDILSVSCNTAITSKDLTLSADEKEELLRIYKEDLYTLTLDDLKTSVPVTNLVFELGTKNRSYHSYLYVYPQFSNTIAFLKNHGFDCLALLDADSVIDLTIHQYALDDSTYESAKDTESAVSIKEKVLHYQDSEQITEILPYLISTDFHYGNEALLETEENIEVRITYQQDEYGNETILWFAFPKGQIPEFVTLDLAK